jgi:hypothetical protein
MKRCPACNRTYVDDSFTFCLNDGALLSPPYDPQTPQYNPSPRTNPPPTEIMPSNAVGSDMAATIPAMPPPVNYGSNRETTETVDSTKTQGFTVTMIVTIILLLLGSILLAVFLARW